MHALDCSYENIYVAGFVFPLTVTFIQGGFEVAGKRGSVQVVQESKAGLKTEECYH